MQLTEAAAQSYKRLTAAAKLRLWLGSHDLPKGRVEVCSWGWAAPFAWVLCCSANLMPKVAAPAVAAGLDSSYWKKQQEEGACRVQWVVLGWGWQTEEEYGMLDFPLGAWATAVDSEELGKRWVVDQAGRH